MVNVWHESEDIFWKRMQYSVFQKTLGKEVMRLKSNHFAGQLIGPLFSMHLFETFSSNIFWLVLLGTDEFILADKFFWMGNWLNLETDSTVSS